MRKERATARARRDAHLGVRIPLSHREELERVAEIEDRPVSSIVRLAIRRELERRQCEHGATGSK
jgi:hypothetical protein